MKNLSNIFLDYLPHLDLHGEIHAIAAIKTRDFIEESIKLGNKKIIIVHGKGTGIVKQSVHDTLKTNKNVIKYHADNFNEGITIVELK